ncbi:MAG: RNA polymerase sigma factor [Raineya sp.]|nr:RNA polymerase sigma factor [Raineya sp.]
MNTEYIDIHKHLVEECRTGSRKAQYELYKLYARAMFGVAMRILNSQGEAEDVLQDSFLDAFQKIDTFKGDSTFGSWLKRIVINKSLNLLKKRRLEFQDIEKHDFRDDSDTEQEQAETESEKLNKIHQAIQLLPDGFRTVLTLYLIEEYSHKQIAEVLNITESTSKSQLNRAKAKLKEILETL